METLFQHNNSSDRAGKFVMTVVTLGGNYQAAPITRGFKITK